MSDSYVCMASSADDASHEGYLSRWVAGRSCVKGVDRACAVASVDCCAVCSLAYVDAAGSYSETLVGRAAERNALLHELESWTDSRWSGLVLTLIVL